LTKYKIAIIVNLEGLVYIEIKFKGIKKSNLSNLI